MKMTLLCDFKHSVIIAQNLESISFDQVKLNHKQENTRLEKTQLTFLTI